MGNSYFVPRSVKGEGRLLIIFTVKSFITTAICALFGGAIWYVCGNNFNMGLMPGLIITSFFGGIGYIIGAAKIPDSKYVGKFRKAGGENLSDIIIRFITFKQRKKVYIYNLKRENKGGK
ncbi:MAG: hypothetical protein RSB76_03595 [Clostridia bacterium]